MSRLVLLIGEVLTILLLLSISPPRTPSSERGMQTKGLQQVPHGPMDVNSAKVNTQYYILVYWILGYEHGQSDKIRRGDYLCRIAEPKYETEHSGIFDNCNHIFDSLTVKVS